MRHCDPRPFVSPHFVAFAWRYRRFVPCLSPQPRTKAEVSPGVGQPGSGRHCRRKRVGLPSSRETLVTLRPVLRPRRDRVRAWDQLSTHPTRPPHQTKTRAPHIANFGAQSHGFGPGCLRLVRAVARTHARLASGCWPQLCRTGFEPAGFLRKVSSLHYPPFPSFLALGSFRRGVTDCRGFVSRGVEAGFLTGMKTSLGCHPMPKTQSAYGMALSLENKAFSDTSR